MNEQSHELLHKFNRLEAYFHRYQGYMFQNRGPLGNPHRGQGRVLSILKMKPEISQKELGYLLDMRTQSLGELLSKLERSGYITREPSQKDRRVLIVRLTEAGKTAAETLEQEDPGADLFACLSEQEQKSLGDYLDRLCAAMEQQFADMGPGRGFHQHPHGPASFGPGWFGPDHGRGRQKK